MMLAYFPDLRAHAGERPAHNRRLVAFLLALLIEGLLVLVLLTLNQRATDPKKAERAPLSFQLIPASEKGGGSPAPKPVPAPRAEPQPPKPETRVDVTPVPVPPPIPTPTEPKPMPPTKDLFPDLVRLDKDTLSAADIGAIPSAPGSANNGRGKDSVAAYGPGAGPGGEPLYNAEWVREPTRAELAYYLPPIRESGWALIACKTVPGNRVDNCRTMGESPLGSGLSRGFRQAAWQFRVYPPRIGGKPIIGAWVRIYYELTVTPAKR
ncbi:hypothetical protein [Sphingomonas sp.]|uniref:hypothetical protein n=1 Tax=Sphingomonas sp. TaxID=28214 RepID=UPI0035A83930